jgi:hypothetical protein
MTHFRRIADCDPELVKPSALAEQDGRGGGAAAPNGKSRSRGIVMTFERLSTNRFGAFVALSLVAATLAASPASAAVTNIETSSTVLDVALIVVGKPVDFGPVLPASGSAPPAYDVSKSLVSFSRSFDTPVGALSLLAGVLVDTASGDTAAATGTASSTLASLAISLDSIFSVDATAVTSTSLVDGTPTARGFSTLADLTIKVLGFTLSIPLDPSPNDVIFDKDGVTVTLNQQIHEVGGGSFAEGVITNAVDISFTDSPLISGHIDFAQSRASITEAPVPELSTWAMMAFGFCGLAFASWRARKFATIA